MRASTLIVKQGISIKELLVFMAVEDEVSKAVRELGYDPDKQQLTIEGVALNRYSVYFGRSYVGIWDSNRHTFVD